MAGHTAEQVAKWFLSYNRIAENDEGGELISNLKLQKLLYYAQGCFLAITDKPLFNDPILAWQHGPVVSSIYHKYKQYGSNGIEFDEDFDLSTFTEYENKILSQVYETFGQYSAWKLRSRAHNEDPWKNTKIDDEINPDLIKDYFKRTYIES